MKAVATMAEAGAAAAPLVYQSVNQAVLHSVPLTARRVLDIGCGGGLFGAALKARQECQVAGVTYSEAEARQARGRIDEVKVGDLNLVEPSTFGRHDCIVCSHVLEHLHAPQTLLRGLQQCLEPGGSLVVALPNVLFWKQRLQFLRGRFRYTEGGLMDSTHFRFFDWDTAAELVCGAGYTLLERRADGVLPLSRLLGRRMSHDVNNQALEMLPSLLGVQFVLVAERAEDAGR